MGKVGILTYFYKSTNYGGVLQSYALCQYLRSLGIDAEQICYDYNTYRKDSAKVLVEKNRLKRYVGKIAKVLRHPLYGKNYLRNNSEYVSKKISNFNSFVESNIPYSNQVYSALDMKEANKIYDIFICGSDQIWNPISMDENFFSNLWINQKRRLRMQPALGLILFQKKTRNKYVSIWKQSMGFRLEKREMMILFQ